MSARLTAKQKAFANAIIAGARPSEAYRQAGYKLKDKRQVSVEASKLLRNPKVALAIEKGEAKATQKAIWSRETAIERLFNVNSNTYTKLLDNRGLKSISAAEARLFIETLDRLNEMHAIKGVESIQVPVFYFDPKEGRNEQKA